MSDPRVLTGVQPRSTDKLYDLAVLVGRFQIFHSGHLGVVKEAMQIAERVLILVGSANRARDTRNPFVYDEREEMIVRSIRDEFGYGADRIDVRPLNDTSYDNMSWITSVQMEARRATKALRPRVCLIGNMRDATSEYLSWFPSWDYHPCQDTQINATALREAFFAGNVDFEQTGWVDKGVIWKQQVPPATIAMLDRFRGTSDYPYLMGQRAAEKKYRETWGVGPYQTVDGVVRLGGHVLMIERGGEEGYGMMALPGGFLDPEEDLLDAAVREVVEETALFIPTHFMNHFHAYLLALKEKTNPVAPPFVREARAKLKGYLKGRGERFADPHRSRRARLITEAFLFDLPTHGFGLPAVQGMDDAKAAFWMPISEVQPDRTFEDHAFIIDKMLNLYA